MSLSPALLRRRPLLLVVTALALAGGALASCQDSSAAAESGGTAPAAASPANVIAVTSTKDFDARVAAAKGPVLVDCFATWCGPCSALTPEIDAVAANQPGLTVLRVDVDAQPELAQRFKAESIPLLVIIKDGKVQNQQVGYLDRKALATWLGG